ncbi:MAG TPA: HEAT repeat domain-containing protein [Dissulfurispiraceae bacterium]|nr:HEAT repeat domain-containing protein [Dissulfurispiraceae bacterium]
MNDEELKTMVLDYMENGYLENIIDMFKHDESLYPLVIDMIKDERVRVRLGAVALVEELVKINAGPFVRLIPAIGGLLEDPNPTLRGDAAYLLGIIRHADALPFLISAKDDNNRFARDIIRDSIDEITCSN